MAVLCVVQIHKFSGLLCQMMTVLFVINGKKLLSLKPVVRTRRSFNRAGLIKQQKSFQGLAMYGHEVFDVLTKVSKVILDARFPFHVSDNRLYRMTV
jgi:hypothetical protein